MADDIGREQGATSMLAANSRNRIEIAMVSEALRHWHGLSEANRVAMTMMLDIARCQQEMASAVTQATLSAMSGGAGPARDFLSQAAAAYGRSCTQGLDAMWRIADAAVGAASAGRAPQP